MSEAPMERIEALHFERGWLEVTPDHEANYWLPERTWQHDNDEGHGISESDLEGWRPVSLSQEARAALAKASPPTEGGGK